MFSGIEIPFTVGEKSTLHVRAYSKTVEQGHAAYIRERIQ